MVDYLIVTLLVYELVFTCYIIGQWVTLLVYVDYPNATLLVYVDYSNATLLVYVDYSNATLLVYKLVVRKLYY